MTHLGTVTCLNHDTVKSLFHDGYGTETTCTIVYDHDTKDGTDPVCCTKEPGHKALTNFTNTTGHSDKDSSRTPE